MRLLLAILLPITLFSQGRCRDGYETKGCPLSRELATAPIKPIFAATGWRTVALDHITFETRDPLKEAAFYAAIMGWTIRSAAADEVVLNIGGWSSAIFKNSATRESAVVTSFCFAIEPWNAKSIEGELRKRGLDPVADDDGHGFESFHVKDPDGFDLQISNRKAHVSGTKTKLDPPFDPTGWRTVWLDHFSYNASNYKLTASFYENLLGWRPTYDEGSQHELMIGDIGDIIVRGGNPNDPNFGKTGSRRARIDHISFGITPWDTDGVKAELEKRGLRATPDTSTHDEIHVAAFKSYHTMTPSGYNLQISYVTRENRLALANAVKPK